MFLLDTNIISEPARPAPNPVILQHLARHAGELAIASVVWHELWFGVEKLPAGQRREFLTSYFLEVVADAVLILPYDDAAASWHARERARLHRAGRTAPFVDGQIAAVAAVNDLTLVTLNSTDFREFAALRITDWSSPP